MRERGFFAGSQSGKTTAAAAETAMHATGQYAVGWKGRRFDRAAKIWAIVEARQPKPATPETLPATPIMEA